MVDQGIITTVGDGVSDCVNSPVIRQKPDGSLYIFLDPKDLNKVKTEHHQPQQYMTSLPDFVEPHYSQSWMLHRVTGMFHMPRITSLDNIKHAQGRYKFLRIPFGLRIYPNIFQRKIDLTYETVKVL